MLARTGVPVLPGQRRAACPLVSTRQAPLRTAQLICRAAAEDPYTVLGIKPDADQNEINRAYTRKKAENRGNEAVKRKIEAAHSALMLNAFNARLKGARGVSKDIKYADEPPLFPWRPKRWDATPQVAMVIGAMQLGLATFGFQSPAMSKIIACMALGVVGNVMKQNAINPGPSDPEMIDENSNRATNNFVRGVLLAIMATFFAIGVGSLPEIATKYVTIPLFKQQPQLIVAIKIAVAALSNWIMTAFYY